MFFRQISWWRWCALLVVAWQLSACGGSSGFSPTVTGFQVQKLQYGGTASFYVGGTDLRSTMVADLGSGCTSPTFSSNSSPSLALLSCTVTAVGDLPLTIKSESGQLLYQTTLTVPKPQVTLTTSLGSITLELDPQAAPNTVKNFLSYVKQGYYSNTLFHRVIAGFMVQGGGFTTGMVSKSGLSPAITLESDNGKHNTRGTVAMARTSDPNSATSQFFINLVDNAFLDYQSASNPGYAVFGTVVKGLDVVDAIGAVATGSSNGYTDVPTTDVTITAASQIQ
jgi:cyclophilin family peptidyl-prolyl cis-trans isomerase